MVGAAAMSMRQVSLENSAISDYFNQEVSFSAQVKTDPSKTATGNFSFTVRLFQFTAQDKTFALRTPVRVLTKSAIQLLPGQTIAGTATVLKSKESRVAALFIVNGAITIQTEPSSWAAGLGAIREGLRENSGDGDAGALIPGMVLGDTSKQSPEFLSLIHI